MCDRLSAVSLSRQWKLLLLLARLFICLSVTPPSSCETWQPEPPPRRSSSPSSRRWKLFFADSPCRFLSESRTQVRVASFSRCVCCILWFIYTFLIVAPLPSGGCESQSLACTLCQASQIPSWNIHEFIHIFIFELPVCFLRSLISCSGPALEWSGMILVAAPHVATKQRRLVLCFHNGMAEAGEIIWLHWRDWGSFFKAICGAEALIGLPSALDVHPVMSLWRAWAALNADCNCTAQVLWASRPYVLRKDVLPMTPWAALCRGIGGCVAFRCTLTHRHTHTHRFQTAQCVRQLWLSCTD